MEREFAVILLDVSMPDMDGFETAQLIHHHPRYESTPIIFVTGVHVSDLDRLKGYEVGAVDYVYVPVVPEILRSKVAVLVELHCQRLELKRLNRSLTEANRQLDEANRTLLRDKASELATLNRRLQDANDELVASNAALTGEIAERRRAEQALRDADRRKDDFLAILAHELRNPLAPIVTAICSARPRRSLCWCRCST
jgi:response regulator RpfG family c-di-GMP phosphodiesterase